MGSTVELVQGIGKPFVFALTQAKPNTRLTVTGVAALSAHGVVAPAIIHDRVDYAGSMIDGRTVQETDPKGRSAAEITEIVEIRASTYNKKHERTKGSEPMRTKRPELTAGLVAVKGGAGAADMSTRADGPVSTPTMAQAKQAGQGREDLVPLNFRLPASFRREFKTYAASHDMKLNELLRLCFDTYRRGKGD